MIRNPRWSLQELAQWALWGHAADRIPDLLRPRGLVWPDSLSSLEDSLHTVRLACGDQIVHQAMAGAALGSPEALPSWLSQWLADRMDLIRLGFPFDWETARTLSWAIVPVPLAMKGLSRLCSFLVGLLPPGIQARPLPPWWETVSSPSARRSVSSLLTALHEREGIRIVLYPLLARLDSVQVDGSSMTLPLYLSAWGLERNYAPRTLLATGTVDALGCLHPVGYLEEKSALAAAEGFSVLLTPHPRRPPPAPPEGLEILTVATLEEAQFLWQSHVPGEGGRLLEHMRSLGDPEWVAANIHLLCRSILGYPEPAHRYRRSLDILLYKYDLLAPYLDNLERMAQTTRTCLHALKESLEPLDLRLVRKVTDRFPLAGFRLAQVRVSCANHCGDPEAAGEWIELSRRLEPSLEVYEQELSLTAGRANRQFIAERHNRYDFNVTIPDDVRRSLEDLEALYSIRKRRSPNATCKVLGELCGTLAQNFAFCGPGHLDSLCRMVAKAQEAFGDGRVPELRKDWLRQFCYLAYALLDAKEYDRAGEALTSFLEAHPAELQPERFGGFDPYQHCLLARYLAETGLQSSSYLGWAMQRSGLSNGHHPEQLWLLNIGDLAMEPVGERRSWMRSVECCLAQGPTVRVMSLMPLARLWSSGLVSEEWMEKRTEGVLEDLSRSMLHLDHFKPLLEAEDWREVLHIVEHRKDRLFPFSYR